MTVKSSFLKLCAWLTSPGVFGSPVQKIPGKWHLYEYYRDWNEELQHVREQALQSRAESMILTFSADEKFCLAACLPIPFLAYENEGTWRVRRNFIHLQDSRDSGERIEFQFAFEKDTLKLLKKDESGRIEFFGFFRQADLS